ncbi:Heat shock protein 16 [Colletotrichum chlorophyti]|uniref:Heat shock protein 16 n=1 Tax=Colletotrichum chlorophyti TaxID=708187 RepID=A0A1Q8RWF4_9PEZI|nr:Heat shock protein 16 [Colletotrichum chlorophyti]
MSWAGPNGNNNPFPRPPGGGGNPFFNFINSFDPTGSAGAGVDHSSSPWANLPAGFPFHGSEFGFGGGPGGWGAYGGWGDHRRGFGHRRGGGRRHGSRGRHGMNEGEETAEETMRDAAEDAEVSDKEKNDSPDTMRDDPEEGPEHAFPPGPGRRGGGRGRFCRGPPGGDHWRHSRHHHGHPGPFGPHGPHPGNFDFASWLNQFADHPLAQNIREWASRFGNLAANGARGANSDFANDDSSFTPPVDVFATDKAYVLHFALPGAKKEDIGVDWDADKGELRVAGVVYRPGDEDFLATMASSERRVGMFSRSVPLPPPGSEREDIDVLSITAKMEDGILIVTVPKLEKEWTEIHKVDIE